MNKKALIKKILAINVCSLSLIGFTAYEVYSVHKKEYEHQTAVANKTHEQIKYNLNMVKIAIQTNNLNDYNEKILSLNENSTTIKSLFLIKNEQNDYLLSLDDYIELLKKREVLLSEMIDLKHNVSNIEKTFKDNYSDKDTISRDKLTNLNSEIKKLHLDEKKYSEKIVVDIITAINAILNEIETESNTLAECIDNCYKDRINEINNGLADKIENFVTQIEELNKTLEQQFDFKTMEELKTKI